MPITDVQYEFRKMLCDVLEEVIGKNDTSRALYFSKRDADGNYRGIILWAPSNYVSVFDVLSKTPFLRSLQSLQEADIKLMSNHDSCWRSDGVDTWFRKHDVFELDADAFCRLKVISVTDEIAQYLRDIRRNF